MIVIMFQSETNKKQNGGCNSQLGPEAAIFKMEGAILTGR